MKIEIILFAVCFLILTADTILLIFCLRKKENATDIKNIKATLDMQSNLNKNLNELLLSTLKNNNDNIISSVGQISTLNKESINSLISRLEFLIKTNEENLERTTRVIKEQMEGLRKENEAKLEQMRVTVDEKLNTSLQTRLNQSFEIINKRLQEVYEGLGEMRSLANGVGDLKKVLTNVKTRGVWGEVQLGNLLEQMLSPNQYLQNAQTKPNSQERVDFAVILPGKDDKNILLPVDAKFPIEDYQRLVEATETGDQAKIDLCKKGIERRVKEEAKKIKEKYISLPTTTDFGVLYLAIEGLYAEVLRNPGLVEQIQSEYKIIICGPTTLSALLSSLQLGFKTLSIEKRSSEIWMLLGSFKQEFSKFVELLSKTQKKLDEASNTIEFATKKSKTIERKLKKVSVDQPLLEDGFVDGDTDESDDED